MTENSEEFIETVREHREIYQLVAEKEDSPLSIRAQAALELLEGEYSDEEKGQS